MMKNERDVLDRLPESLKALSRRKGALLPAGAVIYAEGDTRNFHELLFVYHGIFRKQELISKGAVDSFREILLYYSKRFQGWYDLPELSQGIEEVFKKADFTDKPDLLGHVEKLMVITGHLNSWIDLLIPWSRINRIMQPENGCNLEKGEAL
jgi:hypothetical protein